MAVLPILITGDPVLHSPAHDVTEFGVSLDRLVADLFDTMEAAPGVGLAAPQVGVASRVFVWDWTDDDGLRHRGVAVNPALLLSPTPAGDPDEEADAEGCLSFPGERYPLRRAQIAVLTAVDAHGTPIRVEAEGWLARILQHEYDHLDGTLYVDRLDSAWDRAVAKVVRRSGWGVPGGTWTPGVDDLDA
ncbi:MAG: hypothetical protein RI885_1939 [Actinomycetota bacterium]|jgi:peptide deformylase